MVEVSMTDLGAVQLLATIADVPISMRTLPSGRTLYRARVAGVKKVAWLLTLVRPYLRVKQEQADLVLGVCQSSQERVGKYLSLEALDERAAAHDRMRFIKSKKAI